MGGVLTQALLDMPLKLTAPTISKSTVKVKVVQMVDKTVITIAPTQSPTKKPTEAVLSGASVSLIKPYAKLTESLLRFIESGGDGGRRHCSCSSREPTANSAVGCKLALYIHFLIADYTHKK